jgi:hypothetical protein
MLGFYCRKYNKSTHRSALSASVDRSDGAESAAGAACL